MEAAIRAALAKGRRAFVPFLTAGYPSAKRTLALGERLAQAGADVIELGIPFSDPLADGPVIQRASQEAIASGMTPRHALKLAGELNQATRVPIVIMSYLNPLLSLGETLHSDLEAAGVAGLLMTDLAHDDPWKFWERLAPPPLARIPLVAPTTSRSRLQHIAANATGFVYCVTKMGVTGGSLEVSDERWAERLKLIRRHAEVPVLAGFGVRGAAEAGAASRWADGVVVGSALVELATGPISRVGGLADAIVQALEVSDAA